ncbi:hypothetical protein [Spirochaeta isovalerica]|uniref:Uncharacterized protein n=1 Tax=Spirochaeta isovalerica TaxID=150 RepID=A0A841RFR9_9SPIO|nr:hypothetical protein [Spirochaeta isovalerica]MBB6481840.1 hypothetical protein [Spirochaeta isovalerica]
MSRTIRNILNFQFVLFFASGAVLIALNGKFQNGSAFLLPALLVFIYSAMVNWGLGDCPVSQIVKKRFDSIYLLGALYSVVSLIAMMFELKVLSASMPAPYLAAVALSYLAISISVSVASMSSRYFFWFRFKRAKRNKTYIRYSIIAAGE